MKLKPKRLYEGSREPAQVTAVLHSIIGDVDRGLAGQFGEDNDSVVEGKPDEVYESAGMQLASRILICQVFPAAEVRLIYIPKRKHEMNLWRSERTRDFTHSTTAINMPQPRNCLAR